MKQDTILVVDDMEVNRYILCELFADDYKILEAKNGREALEIIERVKNRLAIILLDIIMPEIDGFQVLEQLKQKGYLDRIPVILITGDVSNKTEMQGYDYGVADIISKPFNSYIVKRRVLNVIDLFLHKNNLEQLVEQQTQEIEEKSLKLKETNGQIIEMLSSVVEFRNLESGEHIKRIKSFTECILKYMRLLYKEYDLSQEKIEMITRASTMHDLGKIAIPDNVLLKPGKLSEDEFNVMKEHTIRGCEIIKTLSFIDDTTFYNYCYEICRNHHERYDGSGYPDHLRGEKIPIAAQIVSLADVYDALVSERVYKNAFSKEQAFKMIMNGECGEFSPKLLQCFKLARKEFEILVDANRNQEEK